MIEVLVLTNSKQITPSNLAQTLRTQRKGLGRTLHQVSRATGLSVSFLDSIELGITNPSLESLHKLLEYYEMNLYIDGLTVKEDC